MFDVETDLKQEKIWLIGLYSYKDGEFKQFFEKDDEESLLKSFARYLQGKDSMIVYYGETTSIKTV